MPAPASNSVVEWLRLRASQEPARPAFGFLPDASDELEEVDYGELDRRAQAVARALVDAGAVGERVLLLHPPGIDFIASLYGCLYAGAIVVPLFPPARGRGLERLRTVASDSGARVALASEPVLRRARGLIAQDPTLARLEWLCTDDLDSGELGFAPTPRAGDELALLQYTSGSTSAPKGVALTQANLGHNIEQLAARTGIAEDDCIVLWLPPYHDMGLIAGVLGPVWTGTRTIAMSPASFLRRPARWLEAMSRYRGTVSGAPNFGYELCARRLNAEQRAALDLRSWRVGFTGAERVSSETIKRFSETFRACGFDPAVFAPCYGLAEATVGVSLGPRSRAITARSFDLAALSRGRAESALPGMPSRALVGCGEPLDGVEVRIVDPESRMPLPDGRIGEIWIRGPNVARGYFNQPELTREVFDARLAGGSSSGDAGYLRSGDLGFLEGGQLFVAGRIKDLVIVGGTNHYAEEIEAAIGDAQPGYGGAVVAFSVETPTEERLVIVLEADSAHPNAAEIARRVRSAVGEALALPVSEVVLVRRASVPKTSSGKVQRGRCREQYLEGRLELVERVAELDAGREPPAELTAKLQGMLAELLELPSIGADDDFFAAGGHSLLATQLVSRVREHLRADLTLRMVFEHPTAAALAQRIADLPRLPPPPAITAIDRSGRMPLSHSQRRMWFMHQLDPESAAYNVAGAARVLGPLDVDALETALAELVARHEILRSNYPNAEGEPYAVIAAHRPPELLRVDLSREPDPEAAAIARAERLANTPFDIARGALFRVALYRISHGRQLLAVSMHHLVTDAWSMGVLVEDLLASYARIRSGAGPAPAPPRVSYVDYARWQLEDFGSERHARELAYWRSKLAGAAPLELPTDRPRPLHAASTGALEPLELPGELIESLRALAAAEGVTLFMLMLAAFELLLHRYSEQTDIVVGVPIANRNHLASEAFIGTLVNTLVFRVQVDPDQSFSALLREVKQTALEAYAHQELPFERLVSELGVARAAGHVPLVQVMFDFQNAPMRAVESAGLTLQPIALSRGSSQFDLSLVIMDTELSQIASLEYRTDLFDAASMQRLLGHYTRILRAVVEDPKQSIAAVPLLSDDERREILRLGRSALPAPSPLPSVAHMFERRAAATPEALAVQDARGALSYRELDARSSALARRLRALGATPGERVAIYLDRSNEIAVALLAVLKTGAAYVPLDPVYPPARIELVMEDSDPRIILTTTRRESDLPAQFAKRACAIDALHAASEEPAAKLPALEPQLNPSLTAYVLYTSGSSGRPKGVEVSVGSLANFLLSMAESPGISPHDRMLSVTTVAFDIAGLEIFLPLVSGACVFLAPAEAIADGPELARYIEQTRPTLMQATPATWRMLIEAGWRGAPSLTILCGGEALPRDLAEALLERGRALWNMYGPTETTIWSTIERVGSGQGPVAIGRPIAGTSVYVLDPKLQLVPLGVHGEICIGGAGIAKGYFGRPALSAQAFRADPFAGAPDARLYRTGDRGSLAASGALTWLGRLDHQIKIRGYRIEPGEIEAACREELGLEQVVVVAREDRPGDPRLIAYHVRGAALPSVVSVKERLRRRLPDYMVPSAFVELEHLPKTPNGKIDRKALPKPDPELEPARRTEPPRDAIEGQLVRLWEEILDRSGIGIHSNFFDLGGHSLLAVRLFARMERELGVTLPLATLLETTSLAELAQRVRHAIERKARPHGSSEPARQRSYPHLITLRAGDASPPVFCVHGAGGNVINLFPLAQRLAGARAFHALAAKGVDGIGPPAKSIHEMARAYLADVRALWPEGPYHIVGYCGGGLVAYEMARMLREAGQRVGLLGMIDTYHPRIDTTPARDFRRLQGMLREGSRYLARRAAAFGRRNLESASRELRAGYHLRRGEPVPFELRDHWLTSRFFRLAAAYEPRPYAGRLTIFYAADKDALLRHVGPELGWTGLADGGIESYEVPGTHETLAAEPHVRVLSQKLGAAIDAAEAQARTRPGLGPR